MTRRLPCPPAPGPLEAYAARFDDLFSTLAQRRGFREYLAGLLLPRDRNKTLTCLAGTEPVAGAQHAAVQRLQFFLSESTWDHEQVNARRVELLLADPTTAPHAGGVLVIDDSGDRKDGKATAHIGRQWLGRLGKTDNGIVTVTTCWADENLYYPLHAMPYCPAHHFPTGKKDPGFRTKLQIAVELARATKVAGTAFRAVAADCAYGDQDGFRRELYAAGLPFVMALKPSHGSWAYGKDAYTPLHAARALTWTDPENPGDWTQIERTFRDGRTETWWAADATLGFWGPDGNVRLVVATTDPATLHRSPPGTWPPTCPAPADPARPTVPNPPLTCTKSSGSTAFDTGSSKATNRSRTNSDGPTSRSAPTPPSAATRPWSPARSPSAGTPGSPDCQTRSPPSSQQSHRPPPQQDPLRGGTNRPHQPQPASWPRAIRAVRAWLDPWTTLQRCWRAWTNEPPPPELQALINAVGAGHPLDLYCPV
ncbi:transposase (plasmid) [Streptomyces sp. NBC_01237]|nr:transposase [Streptomyces sp. NBC_01237]WRZ77721.1 transposase [Streptomyces sp. NBC_01237]